VPAHVVPGRHAIGGGVASNVLASEVSGEASPASAASPGVDGDGHPASTNASTNAAGTSERVEANMHHHSPARAMREWGRVWRTSAGGQGPVAALVRLAVAHVIERRGAWRSNDGRRAVPWRAVPRSTP